MLEKIKNIFQSWLEKKIKISDKKSEIYFREGEIWKIHFGKNIGYEINGKGENFLRPGIILKKINRNTFYTVPLTAQNKDGFYGFLNIKNFKKNKNSFANLMQIKVIDKNRLFEKITKIEKEEFLRIKKESQKFIFGNSSF